MTKKIVTLLLIFISIKIYSLGNPLYNRQFVNITSTLQAGMYGSKDFLMEELAFSYTFRSKNINSFSIRLKEIVFLPGVFTNNLYRTGTIFAVASGFEYTCKLISSNSGISFFIDTGIGYNTFYLATGAGVGSRFNNGIFLTIEYMHNYYISSDIDLYVRIAKYLSIRGNFGIFSSTETNSGFPYIKTGVFPGFHISDYFKLNIGGGFTVTESFVFGFYASLYINTLIPF